MRNTICLSVGCENEALKETGYMVCRKHQIEEDINILERLTETPLYAKGSPYPVDFKERVKRIKEYIIVLNKGGNQNDKTHECWI